MLLRTFLLFLCVSSSLCATLGLFLMQEKDQETPAQDLSPALDNVAAPLDGSMQETEADEKTSNTSLPEEDKSLLETLLKNDRQPEVDKDVHAAVEDVPATEEVVTESDKKTEDIVEANVVLTEGDKKIEDIVEANVVLTEGDKKTEDIVEANVVLTESDKKTEDIVEANVVQEDQLPQQEDNEIKPVPTEEVPKKPEEQPSRWSLNSIRSSFQNMNGYFDSLVELVGGRNGVCQYRCRYGELPAPRPGYQIPEPNGCSSSLVGFQLDLGIPAMTQCCNQLDSCYDTCGTSKYDCDSSFRTCLHGICSDLKKSLGLGMQYQTCESMADGLFNTVWTLGCRPYMNSQRAACVCEEEEKDEL